MYSHFIAESVTDWNTQKFTRGRDWISQRWNWRSPGVF